MTQEQLLTIVAALFAMHGGGFQNAISNAHALCIAVDEDLAERKRAEEAERVTQEGPYAP